MNLSSIDTKELLKRKSRIQGILAAFQLLCVIMIVCVLMIKEKKVVYIAPVLPLSLVFLPLFQQLKAIKKELQSRAATSAK
ncbi:hypothetical protein [Chitinophaga nivalis]|uniref:Redox-active disulfide protein 2 n=1 Tax=Chitinophaga nivalis TaxID=2991709 RepID=A0ABT3IMJ8_9BACT|nr:hypothetical protein [Chitinophaga nivalis]MCW3465121.1 hypothetical protein [Chitinophaga nivalis]MCW3485187.1 hypothetical protein [Chitinophaga nivalis]